MTQNLTAELQRLDEEIRLASERLKAKKKARRQISKALEQLNLTT